ncbi:saccharopine dehydrogenase family protein [Gordonia alkanivorans]|uniref:Saccharopine dehydrogenase NADP binding domain-containing protein n=1 Tax=Gordonia alkanivorans NBRC 16433 TaxID=1027371 RepID=F9W233_9ACTN|nr:saccharopine dehydrogenase NADP-binding domain-containing protein [Gordonia alkanivorans]GAA14893.1 hypothetical protein GOALK_118_00110 [Gordonia alkanivorans NBRC 16433]
MAREFDLVLYGATGFVGRLTADYVARSAPPELRVALAGRDERSLAGIRESLGARVAGWEIARADATDAGSLDVLAARASVIVSTVGPYLTYGLPLVEACAKAGTHYADLTGEPMFTRWCIDGCDKLARESGARIVNSCGFDSIPSDLSVYQLYRRATRDAEGELGDTVLVLRAFRGGMSGGTVASGKAQALLVARDREARRLSRDPYTMTPDRLGEPSVANRSEHEVRPAGDVSPELDGWAASFFMGPHNTRVVRRSNALFDWRYGRDFRYSELMSTGTGVGGLLRASAIAGGGAVNAALTPAVRYIPRRWLDRLGPQPGSGPDARARARGHFATDTFTTTSSGARYRARFAMRGDPGYAATSVMLGETGLALALDTAELPDRAGVLTPAVALGDRLCARLSAAGVEFDVARLD